MMKQKALSIEKMKYLEELGLDTSDASMIWMNHVSNNHVIDNNDNNEVWLYNADNHLPIFCEKVCNAYTLEDILDILSDVNYDFCYTLDKYKGISITDIHGSIMWSSYHCRLQDCYEALIWCVKNGHIKTK